MRLSIKFFIEFLIINKELNVFLYRRKILMEKPVKNLFCLVLSLLLTGCSMTKEEQIDELFADYNKPGMPGAAVMVIKDGEILLQKGYGLADLDKAVPVTDQTNCRLASVTKHATAMSILLLIDEGKLSFQTTLKDVLPDFTGYGSGITIKSLLQHPSGLIDYEDLIPDTA